MKLPAILFACSLAVSSLALAEKTEQDGSKADHLKNSGQKFVNEADMWEELAASAEGKAASELKKFAKMTREEGENLLKAGEALDKRQVRMAQRYEKKAAELCSKRGEMMDDIHAHVKKIKDPNEAPKTKDDKEKKYTKKQETASSSEKAELEEPSSKDAFEQLRKKISRFGEE